MHSYLLIAVISLTTIAIRFMPFILFRKRTPDFIMYLGKLLPMCAMAMLVVFCYKSASFTEPKGYLPGIISGITVVITYKWKHNTALSIITGTVLYMFMIQHLFV